MVEIIAVLTVAGLCLRRVLLQSFPLILNADLYAESECGDVMEGGILYF